MTLPPQQGAVLQRQSRKSDTVRWCFGQETQCTQIMGTSSAWQSLHTLGSNLWHPWALLLGLTVFDQGVNPRHLLSATAWGLPNINLLVFQIQVSASVSDPLFFRASLVRDRLFSIIQENFHHREISITLTFASNASSASSLLLNSTMEGILPPLWLNSCLLCELKESIYLLKGAFVLIYTFMEWWHFWRITGEGSA